MEPHNISMTPERSGSAKARSLSLGTADVWGAIPLGGSCAPQDVGQHPWPPPTGAE